MKRLLILVIAFLLFCSTAQAFQMTLTLESYSPATLSTVSKVIDVSDPNDQLEISRQAALFALSPDGWGLENYGGVIKFGEPPVLVGHLYSVIELIDVSDLLGYELNAEAIQYGLSQSALRFHTDEWVGRLNHDLGESVDNYGVISGNMGGIWSQSPVDDWGEFSVTPVPEPSTFILMGIGLVGLVGAASRRRFKKVKELHVHLSKTQNQAPICNTNIHW